MGGERRACAEDGSIVGSSRLQHTGVVGWSMVVGRKVLAPGGSTAFHSTLHSPRRPSVPVASFATVSELVSVLQLPHSLSRSFLQAINASVN